MSPDLMYGVMRLVDFRGKWRISIDEEEGGGIFS